MSREQFQRLALVTIVVLLATVATNRLMAFSFDHADHFHDRMVEIRMDAMDDFNIDHDINVQIDGERCRFDLDQVRAEADRARAQIDRVRAEADQMRAQADMAREQAQMSQEAQHLRNMIRVQVN